MPLSSQFSAMATVDVFRVLTNCVASQFPNPKTGFSHIVPQHATHRQVSCVVSRRELKGAIVGPSGHCNQWKADSGIFYFLECDDATKIRFGSVLSVVLRITAGDSCVFFSFVVTNAEWRSVMQYRIIVPVLSQNFYFLAESESGNIVRVVPCQRG